MPVPVSPVPTGVLFIRPLHLTPSLELNLMPHSKLEFSKNGNACVLFSPDVDSATATLTKLKSAFKCLQIDYLVAKAGPPPLPKTIVPYGVLIPGLLYQSAFISPSEEVALLSFVDSQAWDTSLKRRVQHYGARFNYSTKKIDSPSETPALGDLLGLYPVLERRIRKFLEAQTGVKSRELTQLTVNEYLPHVGISQHCDTHSVIGEVIVVLSVGGGVDFEMRHQEGAVQNLWVESRSLLVMTGEARYGWTHGIARRAKDRNAEGEIVERKRRVSFTFREVREGLDCQCEFESLCDSRIGLELPTRLR